MDNSFSIDNLKNFLDKHNIVINNFYTTKEKVIFIRVICKDTGNELFITIPSKYPMKYEDSIEILEFIDFSHLQSDEKNEEKELDIDMSIRDEELQDDKKYLDPEEADKLMTMYEEINLELELSNILKYNILNYRKQLYRLRKCVSKIKYKLCIVSKSSICYIDRDNDIYCYVLKKSTPQKDEKKEMVICIDLENFFDNIDNINRDTKAVYKNLYSTLSKINLRQTSIISSRIKQYKKTSEKLSKLYNKREEYEKNISSLNDTLNSILKKEEELKTKINEQSRMERSSIQKSLILQRLENDYNKVIKYKNDSIELIRKIKLEYNNFIIDFDYYLFENIKLLNGVSFNFKKINLIE